MMRYFVLVIFTLFSGAVFSCPEIMGVSATKEIKYFKNGSQRLNVNVDIDKASCKATSVRFGVYEKNKKVDRSHTLKEIPISHYNEVVKGAQAHKFAERLTAGFKPIDLEKVSYDQYKYLCFFGFVVDKSVYKEILKEKYPVYEVQVGYESRNWLTYIPKFNQSIIVARAGC